MSDRPPGAGWIECAGAFIPADVVRFSETVWRRGKRVGARVMVAQVVAIEGPGSEAWVVLEVVACEGDQPEPAGLHVRRKRKNIERNGVERRPWGDESARHALADGEP